MCTDTDLWFIPLLSLGNCGLVYGYAFVLGVGMRDIVVPLLDPGDQHLDATVSRYQ